MSHDTHASFSYIDLMRPKLTLTLDQYISYAKMVPSLSIKKYFDIFFIYSDFQSGLDGDNAKRDTFDI